MTDDFKSLPDFDSLPKVEGMPQGCAWGIFDRDGKKDHLGCINLLTPSVVKEALKEARDGHSVSLNWNLGALQTPGFARKGLVHKVYEFISHPLEAYQGHANDDEIEVNTQSSSQWDSLVHFGHQPTGLYYNGVKAGKDNLTQEFGAWDLDKTIPTLNHWHDRGGMVARGVLIDYRAYADAHGIKFDCFDASKIHVEDLDKVMEWEGIQLKQGDVIIVRTGFVEELTGISGEEQAAKMASHRFCGVHGSTKTARWFWNHHPSAVAGDAPAFEQIPPTLEDGSEGTVKDLVLHPYFLAMFGMTIGEFWDLAALSKMCADKKRYSFLLTSVPLNVAGLVGSPPNALAIF